MKQVGGDSSSKETSITAPEPERELEYHSTGWQMKRNYDPKHQRLSGQHTSNIKA